LLGHHQLHAVSLAADHRVGDPVLPEVESLVTAYGAEIVYSDFGEGSDGAIRLVRELVAAEPDAYFIPTSIRTRPMFAPTTKAPRWRFFSRPAARVTHFIAGLARRARSSGRRVASGARRIDSHHRG